VFAVTLGLSAVTSGLLRLLTTPEPDATISLWPQVGLLFWGISSVPWLLFALRYTGRWTRTRPRTVGLLLAPCLGLVAAILMILQDASDVLASFILSLALLYCLALALTGGFFVVRAGYRYGHLRVGQGLSLAVAPVLTFSGLNFASLVAGENARSAATINATGFVVAAAALVVAVGYYRVFDVTPPAVGTLGEREIVRESDDLVVVVNDEDEIVRINETALEALNWSRDGAQNADLSVLLGHGTDDLRDRETVTLETTTGTRRYDPQVSELTGSDGRELGALVSLRDVTTRRLREQRLSVLNRVLRHNLRNRVQVLRAHAEALDRDGDTAAHTTPIIETVDELTAVGEAARNIDEFVASDTGEVTVDVVGVVVDTLAALDADGTVSVTVDAPERISLVTSHQALSAAVESALENAIEYADAEVAVTVRETPDGCTVRIDDDGPGIPDSELESLDRGVETPLQHTTGLGLWQLKWAVTTLGGDLSFDTTEGTTVEITVPDLSE
jgi:signal transduction histidine kinase